MKRTEKYICFLLLASLCTPFRTYGQGVEYSRQEGNALRRFAGTREHVAEFSVDFRWDSAVLDSTYMGTAERFRMLTDSLSSIVDSRNALSVPRIKGLTVVSYSSPEGQFLYNKRLSERRAAAMQKHLRSLLPEYGELISVSADGESWQLFRARVLSDPSLSEASRSRLLEIIDAPITADQKKVLIKQYDAALWRRAVREWFPEFRRSFISLEWEEDLYRRDSVIAAVPAVLSDELPTVDKGGRIAFSTRVPKTLLEFRTNILYDLATALNFEIEIPVGQHFSIVASDLFPWWTWGPNDRKYAFQIWEIGFEPRWYPFSGQGNGYHDGRMSGAFVGAYLASAAYDLQWDTAICTQGEYWTAGISAGYVFPLGRRLRAELSAAIGFLSSDYRQYQPDPDYEHLYRDPFRTGTFSYFGPTRLKASLVLPISVRRRVNSGPFNIVAR